MRIIGYAVALLTVSTSLLVAGPARAADQNVLVEGAPDGPAVAVGAEITAGLRAGTSATFFNAPDSTTGVTCTTSGFTGTVLTNPEAGGVATESLTGQTFADCTSNTFGVTGVQSLTVGNLPYVASVDGTAKTVTVTPSEVGPIQATVVLDTIVGTVDCTFEAAAGAINGVAANEDNSITFTNQQFTRAAGSTLCPAETYLTAAYAPVVVSSSPESPAVFVQ
jgi:trans-2-enoyl-CoA reductase